MPDDDLSNPMTGQSGKPDLPPKKKRRRRRRKSFPDGPKASPAISDFSLIKEEVIDDLNKPKLSEEMELDQAESEFTPLEPQSTPLEPEKSAAFRPTDFVPSGIPSTEPSGEPFPVAPQSEPLLVPSYPVAPSHAEPGLVASPMPPQVQPESPFYETQPPESQTGFSAEPPFPSEFPSSPPTSNPFESQTPSAPYAETHSEPPPVSPWDSPIPTPGVEQPPDSWSQPQVEFPSTPQISNPFEFQPQSESQPQSLPTPEPESSPFQYSYDSNPEEPDELYPLNSPSGKEYSKDEVEQGSPDQDEVPFKRVEAEEEPIEAEIVESPSQKASEVPKSLDEPAESSFSEKLVQLLHEANLTTRHLKFCGIFFVVGILIILAAVFLVPRLLSLDFSFLDSEQEEQSQEDVEPDEEPSIPEPSPAPSPQPGQSSWVDPSIYGGLLLGETSSEWQGATGTDVGLLVGESGVPVLSQFQDFLKDLEALYTLYYVDLNVLLNASPNRTQVLDQHLVQFRELYTTGLDHYQKIRDIRAVFSTRFSENNPQKQAYETEFFTNIQNFDGPNAEENLLSFIELSQQQVDLRAKYLAFGKLEEFYTVVLQNSERRIKDIELNREALIAGVQVVDVYGSDLDLILKETELGE